MSDDHRVRQLLEDSLILWRVDGSVERAEQPLIAVVRARGAVVGIERAAAHRHGVRWFVHTDRRRPRASIAGVLGALRHALGIQRHEAVRVLPGAPLP